MFTELPLSPLAPGLSPVRIHYRDSGEGFPLVFLHGGWGYEVYPFDAQARSLAAGFRILIPDRSGYGRSPKLDRFARPLHVAGAQETLAFLDALGIERAVLWGHSDGAVMAANAALEAPGRVAALVLEATHFDRKKPRSRAFFSGLVTDPDAVGPRVAARLQEEHGDAYWKQILAMEGDVWMEILEGADAPDGALSPPAVGGSPEPIRDGGGALSHAGKGAPTTHSGGDLFQGRLGEVSAPTLFLHGADDPRTEPGELASLQALLPHARFHVIPGAGHSPHSERDHAFECARVASEFLRSFVQQD